MYFVDIVLNLSEFVKRDNRLRRVMYIGHKRELFSLNAKVLMGLV
jgi:hypothetical protein